MALPTEKTKQKTDFLTARVAVVGNPKVGKSTFASKLGDGVIFAATESGLDYLEVFSKKIDVYEDFINLIKDLESEKHGFKTVAIDTVDKLIEKAEEYICRKNKVNSIKDIPYGDGYKATKKLVSSDLDRLSDIGMGYTIITHSKDKQYISENIKYTAIGTSMSASYEESILGLVDFIFYCYVDSNKKRMMLTKPTKFVQCAGDRSNILPPKMEMDPDLIITALKNNKQNQKIEEIQKEK